MSWWTSEADFLGTKLSVEFEAATDIGQALWTEAERLEARFSRFRTDSELSQFNEALDQWHEIDAEWQYLLTEVLRLHLLTEGALDATVQSVLESWGYDADYSLQQKVEAGTLGVITLEPNRFKATAPIDFGSFGKGYFLDRVRLLFEQADVPDFCINAGGDLYAQGLDPQGKPWQVFCEDPRDDQLVIADLVLDGQFFAASAPSKRQWRDKHHLVDTEKLAPASDMRAVFVLGKESGLVTDALSTALFVMGFERAKILAEQHKLAVMLISMDGSLWRHSTFPGTLYTI